MLPIILLIPYEIILVSDMPSSAERESKLDDLNTQFRLFEKYMGVRILTLGKKKALINPLSATIVATNCKPLHQVYYLPVDYGRMKLIFSNIDKIDPERKFIVEMKIEKSNQGKKIWSGKVSSRQLLLHAQVLHIYLCSFRVHS